MQSLNKRRHQKDCKVTSNLSLPQICVIEFFQEVYILLLIYDLLSDGNLDEFIKQLDQHLLVFGKSQTIDMGRQAFVFYVN